MISSHALIILILALAVACVLMCSALVWLQRHIDRGLDAVNDRIGAIERQAASKSEAAR